MGEMKKPTAPPPEYIREGEVTMKRIRTEYILPEGENMGTLPEFNRDVKEDELRRELMTQRSIVQQLYSIIVRCMVVLKYLIRAAAVVTTWRLLGQNLALMLLGFILVVGLLQLGIDKTRKVVNPGIKLSEWNIL